MTILTTPLDTRVEIITPENIAFKYQVAGPFRRLIAYLIDVLVRVGACLVVLVVSVFFLFGFRTFGLGGLAPGLGLVIWFLLEWFYGGLFETFWNGQTPGKRLARIRVLSVEGTPVNGLQAVLRNVLRGADAMPPIFVVPSYLVGLVAATMNDRFQRLGDLASGTMVVVEEPQRHYGVARVNEPEALRLAAELPANFQVSRSLARALSTYVQRRQLFPWRRRAEIAMHVGEPLRARFALPPGTSHDLLLCALYHRAFIADRADEEPARSPFAAAGPRQAAPPALSAGRRR